MNIAAAGKIPPGQIINAMLHKNQQAFIEFMECRDGISCFTADIDNIGGIKFIRIAYLGKDNFIIGGCIKPPLATLLYTLPGRSQPAVQVGE